MSNVTKPVMLDETGHLIVEGLARQNLLLSEMVNAETHATPIATLNEIHEIVRSGEAENVFSLGDQINLNWNDGTNNHILPWDIVAFRDVELEDGETKPGMIIQSHYAMEPVQFGASIAPFVGARDAGTYHFTIGTTWGSHCVAGKVYQFALTQAVPDGGQIVIGTNSSFYAWGAPDTAATNWRVYTFASPTSVTPIETVALTEGSGGTDLGSIASNVAYNAGGFANLQACAYGYNRWAFSSMRKYLNSSAGAGAWWTASFDGDRPAQQAATLRGFKAGFDEGFLNIIKPVKVVTALNTVSDSAVGTSETTYDTFFLASLEEEYIVPQLSGVEGAYWPYWKERLGISAPQQYHPTVNANHIRTAYNARTSAQHCRLRSANRGYAHGTWYVYAAGYAYSSTAEHAGRGCPTCVIC